MRRARSERRTRSGDFGEALERLSDVVVRHSALLRNQRPFDDIELIERLAIRTDRFDPDGIIRHLDDQKG